MGNKEETAKLEQELRKVKELLAQKEADLELYKTEVQSLNVEVKKILMNLDKELHSVRKAFSYLVPSRFPHISGFQFSTKFLSGLRFNGDYIDVFEMQDRFRFKLILSSTQGPALTALLIGFLLKFGRAKENTMASPEAFVDKVLEEIHQKEFAPDEIQLACCHINKRTYELELKAHGQVKCFYQKHDSQQVIDLGSETDNVKQVLRPYDRLVMLSPGIMSATNSKGELFSSLPVLESMAKISTKDSVHNLRNDIFFKLDRHLGGRRPMQDQSIIIMSVDNNIIKLV